MILPGFPAINKLLQNSLFDKTEHAPTIQLSAIPVPFNMVTPCPSQKWLPKTMHLA